MVEMADIVAELVEFQGREGVAGEVDEGWVRYVKGSLVQLFVAEEGGRENEGFEEKNGSRW